MRCVETTISILTAALILSMAWSPPRCGAEGSGQQWMADGEKLVREFKFSDAERALKQALAAFQSAGDKAGMALCLEKLGGLACELGDFGTGLRLYDQAMKLYSELQQKEARARVLAAAAIAYDDWGDLPGAVYFYTEALKIEPNPFERARIDSRLASVYLLLGDPEECVNHLKSTLAAARSGSDPAKTASLLLQVGEMYKSAGYAKEAREVFQEAMGMKARPDITNKAEAFIGDLDFLSRDYAAARSHYQNANYHIGLGRISLAENNSEEASKHFQGALIEGERLHRPDEVFAARTAMGLINLAQQRVVAAEENMRLAVEALEEVRELLPVGRRMHFLSGATHGFNHMATYDALVIILATQGKNVDAFKMAEYTRSRVLTEALSSKASLVENPSRNPLNSPSGEVSVAASQDLDDSPESIESAPFALLYDYFQGGASSNHDAAICSLFVKAALQDFEKSKTMEAESRGGAYCQRAGFNIHCEESLKRKLSNLRNQGVQNHLTSCVQPEEEKK